MPNIYLNPSLWTYKMRKLGYLMGALYDFTKWYLWIGSKRISQPSKKFIGILLAQHLGDIVAAEPILNALHQKYKNAEIYWIIKPGFADLISNHPKIAGVILEPSLLFSIYLTRLNPFHHFYNLHLNDLRSDPYFGYALINKKANEQNITIQNYYENRNLLSIFSQLSYLNLGPEQPELYINRASINVINHDDYWVIHRKSTDIVREWSDENWQQLVSILTQEFDLVVVEIGTDNPLNYVHENYINLVGKTSLSETCSVIKSAKFFIGIDSGPTHIANAYKIPGFIICGQFANFKKYMSYSGAYQKEEIATIYFNETGSARELGFLEVFEKLQEKIKNNKIKA